MPFTIIRQDITKMKVDAIVNAANTKLAMGGGVCGAIFKAAGTVKLQQACRKAAPIKTGEAAITPGFSLPAKYVIHAAGPVYSPHHAKRCAKQLSSAYTRSLQLALNVGCTSIAFPLISSGIFGYPKEDALQIAASAIKNFLSQYDMNVYLVIYDSASFAINQKLMGQVESYIDENYISAHQEPHRILLDAECAMMPAMYAYREPTPAPSWKNLDDIIQDLDEPFNITLLRLIDAKGKTDPEVYKKANIDRKLFSKIRNGKGYMPGKRTVIALAIALELTLEETDDLLKRAGYALSHSQKFDVIIEFFIINNKYDIYEINEILFKYDQPLLGVV